MRYGGEERGVEKSRKSEHGLLGSGKYHDWTYGQIMKSMPNYATYICQESEGICEEQQQFQQWVALMKFESEKEAGEEWKEQNPKKPMR